MTLYFGGISAFMFWRAQNQPREAYGRCRASNLEMHPNDFCRLEAVEQQLPISFRGRLHLCTCSLAARKQRGRISYSVMSPPVPNGAFVRVGEGVYIASPELCYAQMANCLSPVQTMKWGMELCGFYRVDPWDGKLVSRGFPLTDVAHLRTFLDSYSGRLGARRAKEAARWLMDGSASPPESQMALLFRVPRKASGCGLGVPSLNYEVKLSSNMQRIAGKPRYYLDEYWKAGNLAVEYESDACHSYAGKVASDRRRRNILQRIGYRVITVNTDQLKNMMEVDDIAAQIAEAVGLRQKPVSDGYWKRHAEFHKQIMREDQLLRL